MYLTKEEERILDGEYGESMQKAIEILIALGKIYDADRLIPIKSAHVSGVSYYNIGDSGLIFLRDFLSNIKVRVKTTINPSAMDIYRWGEMWIEEKFAKKQMEIINVFKNAGLDITLTCTPYLTDNKPEKGDHIAWSESSALTYANSVIGAMTNRESGISALAAAIIGKTPNYGLHRKEERSPKVKVKLRVKIKNSSDYGVLGYILSKKLNDEIPWIEGLKKVCAEELKLLSASISTYTKISMFHIPGVTAEWEEYEAPSEVVEVDNKDFKEAYDYLQDSFNNIDMVWIGCPHTTINELKRIAKLLKDKTVKTNFWITTSRKVRDEAEKLGYVKTIENAGAKVLCDTCLAVTPLKGKIKTVVTNSAKACYYLRGINKLEVKVAGLEECINVALTGTYAINEKI